MHTKIVAMSLMILCAVSAGMPLFAQQQKAQVPGAPPAKRVTDLAPIRTVDNILTTGANYSASLVSKNSDDYFELSDKPPTTYHQNDVNLWSESDKKIVREALKEVFQRVPGLVLHAAAGRKIGIFRASSLPAQQRTGSFEAAAVMLPEGLLLNHSFFKKMSPQHRVQALIHELVHSADAGGQIELSKEWVDFANPTISKLRLEHKKDMKAKPYPYWVSRYGTDNLTEALAEYFCSHELKWTNYQRSLAFDAFAKRLTSPTQDDLRYEDHFKNGRILTSAGKYKEAIREFEKGRALRPECAIVHIFLAGAYGCAKDYQKSLLSANKAVALLRDAGVPNAEPDAAYLYQVLATDLEALGKYEEAVAILDKQLLSELSPSALGETYRMRGRCLVWLNRLSESAADGLQCFKPDKHSRRVWNANMDRQEIFRRIDENIARYPKVALCYEVRIKNKIFSADGAPTPAARKELLESALQDVELAMACPDADKPYLLIVAANLHLKLNDFPAARKAYAEARNLDPQNMRVRIFNLKLLQMDGKDAEAKREYLSVMYALSGKKKPAPVDTQKLFLKAP